MAHFYNVQFKHLANSAVKVLKGQLIVVDSSMLGDPGSHMSSVMADEVLPKNHSEKLHPYPILRINWPASFVSLFGITIMSKSEVILDRRFWSGARCLFLLQSCHPFTKILIESSLRAMRSPLSHSLAFVFLFFFHRYVFKIFIILYIQMWS